MKTKTTVFTFLLGVIVTQAQLFVDFGPTGSNPLEPGFQGYSATTGAYQFLRGSA